MTRVDSYVVDVLRAQGELYGVPLQRAVSRRMNRDIALGTIYAACDRLEEAGAITSREGEATAERGW